MNKDDFNKLFEGINAENFQEKLLDIKDILSNENETLENTKSILKQKDDNISQLRDTNQRLFLRISENTSDGAFEEEKESISLNGIIDDIMKGDN